MTHNLYTWRSSLVTMTLQTGVLVLAGARKGRKA